MKIAGNFPFQPATDAKKIGELGFKKIQKTDDWLPTYDMFKQTLDQYFLDFILSWCSMFMQSSIDNALFLFLAFEVNLCVAMHIDKRERIMLTALQQDAIVFGCHAQILVCVFV